MDGTLNIANFEIEKGSAILIIIKLKIVWYFSTPQVDRFAYGSG